MNPPAERQQGTVYVASHLVAGADTVFAPGAVAVAGDSVLLAGTRADVLRAVPAGFTRLEFPGAVILPGLVNAHTHLQIPLFADPAGNPLPVPPSFSDWILHRTIPWRRSADPASLRGNFSAAAKEALSFGTTSAGEISGPDLSAYADSPVRVRVFVEGIGLSPGVAEQVLAEVAKGLGNIEEIARANPLVRPGVSPHTLYTVGEGLLRALSALAAEKRVPACLHMAEHLAETDFLANGSGEIGEKLYPGLGVDVSWFRGIGVPIREYLLRAGLLRDGLLLAHNVHLARPEIDELREGGARFVLCPRSNSAHGNGEPDITHFVDAGIPFSLGTDSLGSVPDLSPWAEMRRARAIYNGKKKDGELCRELFRAATENGAAALALPGGILAPGGPADFAVVDDPGGEGDPLLRNLVGRTERGNVRLTVVAGRPAHGDAE